MKRVYAIRAFILIILSLSGCSGGQTSFDKIGDAQFCLDKLSGDTPASGDVDTCLAKVNGVSTAGAEGIRCAGGFIREGFGGSGARFIAAFTAINGGTSTTNIQTLMGIITFTNQNSIAGDFADTQTTFNSCVNSTGRGSTLLAGFAVMAMALSNYYDASTSQACGHAPTSSGGYQIYDIGSCISNLSYTTQTTAVIDSNSVVTNVIAAQTTIGNAVISVANISCSGSTANAALCGTLTSAVTQGGGDPRSVGASFLQTALGL